MSNSIAPGSSADVNVRVTALTTNPNVPAQYKTIILKKNLVNGVNTLTQEMMNQTNTKYVIKYDYVLGDDITVPVGCILEFDGGSISASGSNDTITGIGTIISGNTKNIFGVGVSFDGTWANAQTDSEMFVSSITAFNVIMNNLVNITAPNGKIDVRRNLTLPAAVTGYAVTLNEAYEINFHNTTITAEAKSSLEDAVYLFAAPSTTNLIRNISIKNVIVNATANLPFTYDGESGMTSAVGFCYFSNFDGCLIENITFNHCDVGLKFAIISLETADIGRKNITVKNCNISGKDPIYVFDCDNVEIINCTLDNTGGVSKNHVFYFSTVFNYRIINCLVKNSGVPFNIMHGGTPTRNPDIANGIIENIVLEDCGCFLAIKAGSAIINNIRVKNSTKSDCLLLNLRDCSNIEISNIIINEADNVGKCTISLLRSSYVTMKNFCIVSDYTYLSAQTVKNIILKDSLLYSKVVPTGARIIFGNGDSNDYSDIIIENCKFDVYLAGGSVGEIICPKYTNINFKNCKFLSTGATQHTYPFYLVWYSGQAGKTRFENCYVEVYILYNKDALYNDYPQPICIDCSNENGKLQDFPFFHSESKANIDKWLVYNLKAADAGYLCYDTTNSKLIMWNGSAMVNTDGSPLT